MTEDERPLALVDEAHALYVELDDFQPLWAADLDQIERWFSTSPGHTADVRRRADAMVERAVAAADTASTDAGASLLTVAALLRQLAADAEVMAERTMASPTMGLLGLLHTSVPTFALATPEHGGRYREKLRRFPAAVDELRARLETAVAGGRVQTRRNAEATAGMIDRLLAADDADDPLAGQSAPTELDTAAATAFHDDLVELVRSHTRPALVRLRETLRDVSVPAGAGDDRPGIGHLPGGEEDYARMLAAATRPGMTADEAHAAGHAQLQRLEDEWAAVGHAAFGVSDPVEVRRLLAALPGRQSAEEVRRDAQRVLDLASDRAPEWFTRVPRSPCEIKLVETGGIAYYGPPSEDGTRPGYCHLNVADPSTWAATLAAVTAHEAIPGHHYQLALAREDQHLHRVHRETFLHAFGEGWALYAERIGDQMGLFPDPVDRLGMLSTDAWRAARMVVDTGLHAFGWTRERAVTTLQEHAGLQRANAEAEVDRFCSFPGQAVSYMHGRLAIEAARERAATTLGAGFDVAAFHDVVLSRGMVSLDALDAMVDEWLANS